MLLEFVFLCVWAWFVLGMPVGLSMRTKLLYIANIIVYSETSQIQLVFIIII